MYLIIDNLSCEIWKLQIKLREIIVDLILIHKSASFDVKI